MVVSKKCIILLIISWGDLPDQQKYSVQYQYDTDHRLTAATGETDFQYIYDAVGNLLALNRNGSSTQVTPNMLNQVAIAGATQYLYDANGNNTVIHNLWCGQRLCTQFNSSGTTARYFPQGQMKDGTAYLYARNQVGSVVAMVGLDGQVKGRTNYGPYGQITSQSGIQPDFAYAGLYRHQHSGLYLATFRAYNPAIGRWLNRDPIKEAGGINLYGYVMGNPVNIKDINGLSPFNIPGLGVASSNYLGGMVGRTQAAVQWRGAKKSFHQEFNRRFQKNAVAPDFQRKYDPLRSISSILQYGGEGLLEDKVKEKLKKRAIAGSVAAIRGITALKWWGRYGSSVSSLALGLDAGDVLLTSYEMLQCTPKK